MPKKTAPTFEQALAELEQLVERMEHGDISLEESLECFERGVHLTRTCQQALLEAEQKVQQLIDQDGKPELTPFESDER